MSKTVTGSLSPNWYSPSTAAIRAMPFFLWVRILTGQRLVDLHRQHLGAKMLNAGLEDHCNMAICPR
jgi:RNA polymerase sigma-70 factor (ECF subfamily)